MAAKLGSKQIVIVTAVTWLNLISYTEI